ncbi:MAG: SURF1 family protein [Methylophilaceae bacterium]|nr:SURF1 family protein [Methylophilaceae bacterium]
MSYLQFRLSEYRFRPSLVGTLLMLVCIPLFIKFGFWQYNKAEQKQMLQDMYDQALLAEPVDMPLAFSDVDSWRYWQVKTIGTYQTEHQILLDNQVEQERAGYHVITPLQLGQSGKYVLVNRGWVEANPDKSILPELETPSGEQEIVGYLWLPSTKFYSLEQSTEVVKDGQWQSVWQNMDMQRYQQSVPFEVLPLAIRLDPNSNAGGYSRIWPRPAERITTHIGYAYQWFGFAVAALLIWLFTAFKRQKSA